MQPQLAVMAVRPLLRQHLTLLLNFCALEVFIVGFTMAVPFSVMIIEIFSQFWPTKPLFSVKL